MLAGDTVLSGVALEGSFILSAVAAAAAAATAVAGAVSAAAATAVYHLCLH